ncbi:MAG TPA: YbgC/FadM family acyl-CoA thioesterase [Sphingomicrobium sp.]|jgi:acyl-CoA thioester hydrolase|nr:YbgC/FadM family acyl-CoA thioesterase [Sphingomicrobium sp.]
MSDLDQPYRGGFVDSPDGGREHHFALTVYFEDTDTAGIVYYANYLKFIERARSDMIRASGVDLASELRANGNTYAVAEVAIKYRKPAYLGDDLVVVSTIDAVRAVSVTIHQRVMRGAEEIADATVTAAFLTSDQRPQRQPRAWVERFKRIAAKGDDDASNP